MTRKTLFAAALVAVFAAVGCAKEANDDAASNTDAVDLADEVPGSLVIDFKDGTTKADYDAWEKDWGVDVEFNSVEGQDDGVAMAVGVSNEAELIKKIKANPNVESVEPLYTYTVPESQDVAEDEYQGPVGTGFPNDPMYAKQWNLKQIDADKAWDRSRGKGVIVAVLDTGIAYEDYDGFKQVPDLKGAKFAEGYDFVNDDTHANDDHGHGTHVAGTIAQSTNNGEGVAGVAFEATLMPVKVLNHFGSGTSADIADAIRWAADHGAKVINMSLGGGGRSSVMENAITYARKKGVTVVCAAGNGARGHVEYPAAYEGSVAVSAVGPDKTLASYSSWGKELDIAAPGGDKQRGGLEAGILQNTIDARDNSKSVYAYYNGTSMATPHVAAVAALLYAAGAKTPEQVEQALYDGAVKVAGQADWSDKYGHGLLNAKNSLDKLKGGATNWSPLLWSLALLALVLLTLGAKQRPGYLNILFKGSFLVPLLLSTVGMFVLKWLAGFIGGGASSGVLEDASLPIPDWQDIIFGRGRLANPLFYSALIPIGLSVLGIKWKGWRPAIGGIAVGFAGFLAYTAFAQAPALSYMPFKFLALPWLAVNTIVCMFVARAMLQRPEGVK
ncbi:MAG: S8 family serine peptidase [Myxococcaceae bacterium]